MRAREAMMTRVELIDALESYASAYDLAHITGDNYWVLQSRREMMQARDAILTAFDIAHARIADLEEQIAEVSIYSHEIVRLNEATARISELERACEAALPWVSSQVEYPGDPCEKVAKGLRLLLEAKGGER